MSFWPFLYFQLQVPVSFGRLRPLSPTRALPWTHWGSFWPPRLPAICSNGFVTRNAHHCLNPTMRVFNYSLFQRGGKHITLRIKGGPNKILLKLSKVFRPTPVINNEWSIKLSTCSFLEPSYERTGS